MWWIPFLKMSMTFIKVVKNQIKKIVYLPLKPTWRSCFCLFHSHNPKPKQNHQISITRAKIRSTRSQTCVKYRGIIIFIEHRWPKNTSHIFFPNMVDFPDVQFLQNFIWIAFNLMLDWRAVTVTVHLAPWSKGHSLSVRCYDFCLHAILFL